MTDEPHKELPPELKAVLSRNPDELPPELPRGGEIPADLDPFEDGILLQHQKEWIDDTSDLKLGEKGRRTGITFAEALDDTLLAATARPHGMNVFYVGDTKEKGREFIGYVAHFAKVVAGEMGDIEEFLFEDQRPDGSSKYISAYRVRFASGFRIEALSSRPENIRGLQGKVVIDEAAFHKDVRLVLDAVNALLIWGGKVAIISTHNGMNNPFNELIAETKAGKAQYSLHHIPFSKAVKNGLFRRVCAMKGEEWTPEGEIAWEAKIRGSYGVRTSAMAQELDCIPSDAQGAALSRVMVERCMQPSPIVRWALPDSFKSKDEAVRKAEARVFFEAYIKPHLDKLDKSRSHCLGQDFARTGDLSAIAVLEIGRDLVRRSALLVEMRNIPFDQQREILFLIIDHLPRFAGGALDAGGNGAYLAEVAAQKYGEIIHEVKFTAAWYGLNMPPFIEAFSDETILLPQDEDVLRDIQSLAYVGGIIRVPDDARFKGSDGFERHGDTAIAYALAYHASRQDFHAYESMQVGHSNRREADDDDGDWGRDIRDTHAIGNMRGAFG